MNLPNCPKCGHPTADVAQLYLSKCLRCGAPSSPSFSRFKVHFTLSKKAYLLTAAYLSGFLVVIGSWNLIGDEAGAVAVILYFLSPLIYFLRPFIVGLFDVGRKHARERREKKGED